jgi:hypothetical protein
VTSVVFQAKNPATFTTSASLAISNQTETSLTVTIPQLQTFPTDVLVCSATGCSQPDPAVDTFQEAYAGRPIVSSSGPASGPAHGGTIVTIQGSLDAEVTAVDFGRTPATIVSEAEGFPSGPLIVLAPPGKAGTKVSITITTVGGTFTKPPQPRSAPTRDAVFTYKDSSPAAPRRVSATAGVKSATVRWKAPADNGGGAVTRYVITGRAKGHRGVVMTVSAREASVTFKDLAARIAWRFTVQAVNRFGTGLPATSRPVRPGP